MQHPDQGLLRPFQPCNIVAHNPNVRHDGRIQDKCRQKLDAVQQILQGMVGLWASKSKPLQNIFPAGHFVS
ncbi:unnamed protein product [Rhodiola kirilowii]